MKKIIPSEELVQNLDKLSVELAELKTSEYLKVPEDQNKETKSDEHSRNDLDEPQ